METKNNYQENFDEYSKPMTIKDWIITYLLMLIPIANIVFLFMWAFGSKVNKSKKTYFQATLIMLGIMIALWIILAFTLFAGLAANM